MKLFLIRHPEPDVDPGICYGHTDLALKRSPKPCARRISSLLPPEFRLFSSPLRRALELAQCLGTPETDARLLEMNFGEWENRSFDEFRLQVEDWAKHPLDYCPPKGESGRQVASRVWDFYKTRLQSCAEESVVIIGHSGPLRLLIAQLLGLELQAMHALNLQFSKLCELEIAPAGPRLNALNL